MKIAAFGIFFVIMLMVFIVGVGVYGFTNTSYVFDDKVEGYRTITLVKSGFSSLAGILCLAYFLHGLGHMITRNAKNPANNV